MMHSAPSVISWSKTGNITCYNLFDTHCDHLERNVLALSRLTYSIIVRVPLSPERVVRDLLCSPRATMALFSYGPLPQDDVIFSPVLQEVGELCRLRYRRGI